MEDIKQKFTIELEGTDYTQRSDYQSGNAPIRERLHFDNLRDAIRYIVSIPVQRFDPYESDGKQFETCRVVDNSDAQTIAQVVEMPIRDVIGSGMIAGIYLSVPEEKSRDFERESGFTNEYLQQFGFDYDFPFFRMADFFYHKGHMLLDDPSYKRFASHLMSQQDKSLYQLTTLQVDQAGTERVETRNRYFLDDADKALYRLLTIDPMDFYDYPLSGQREKNYIASAAIHSPAGEKLVHMNFEGQTFGTIIHVDSIHDQNSPYHYLRFLCPDGESNVYHYHNHECSKNDNYERILSELFARLKLQPATYSLQLNWEYLRADHKRESTEIHDTLPGALSALSSVDTRLTDPVKAHQLGYPFRLAEATIVNNLRGNPLLSMKDGQVNIIPNAYDQIQLRIIFPLKEDIEQPMLFDVFVQRMDIYNKANKVRIVQPDKGRGLSR